MYATSAVCLTFLFTLNHYQAEHCFCFTQTFKLGKNNGVCQQLPEKLGQLWRSKMSIYTFSAYIFVIPFAVISLPFICDYEPQQLFLQSLIATLIPDRMIKMASKVGAAVLYTLTLFHLAAVILYCLLIYISVGDTITRLTFNLKGLSTAVAFRSELDLQFNVSLLIPTF